MTIIVLALLIVPVAAATVALWLPAQAAGAVTATAGVASFGLVLALIPASSRGTVRWLGLVRIDALSVVFLLATGFLYACVAVYSIGYLRPAVRRMAPGTRSTRAGSGSGSTCSRGPCWPPR